MKKLVCDRCGLTLKYKEDVDLAIDSKEAWEEACLTRGVTPRGLLPCKNYVRCGGEIRVVRSIRQWIMRLLVKRR